MLAYLSRLKSTNGNSTHPPNKSSANYSDFLAGQCSHYLHQNPWFWIWIYFNHCEVIVTKWATLKCGQCLNLGICLCSEGQIEEIKCWKNVQVEPVLWPWASCTAKPVDVLNWHRGEIQGESVPFQWFFYWWLDRLPPILLCFWGQAKNIFLR